MDGFEREVPSGEVAQEADLRLPAEASREEIGDLGDHEARDKEGAGVALEQLEASRVVGIVAVDIRVQRPGVDDQRDRLISAEMICSIRSEMSDCPLWPAAAAPSRRRVPTPSCTSSAVRVTSAIVVPRRWAS